MRTNTKVKREPVKTHEGGQACLINDYQTLRRSVSSCLLWEDSFYEDGISIADRIGSLVPKVDPAKVAALAVEARVTHNLRHVPLLLAVQMCKHDSHRKYVADTLEQIIKRADELCEFLALYGVNGGKRQVKLAAQVKKGLARAFVKFDEYQLAKYNRDNAVKLRDVMFLVHPTPKDDAQAAVWKRLVDGNLATPDTWEVALSAAKTNADKQSVWVRLLSEGKLGYLALLRNLRNMMSVGVDSRLVSDAIIARKGADRVLPFRYVAAARACPQLEPVLDQALIASINEHPVLDGNTIILVDVSGSMSSSVSGKSDMTRMDAAATLASMIGGNRRTFSFSYETREVPPRLGMAGVDAIINSQQHGGTDLGGAVTRMNALPHDRLIVITDEQSATRVPDPVAKRAYMINVASYRNGVGYGKWTHLDGFSESVLKFIFEHERIDGAAV